MIHLGHRLSGDIDAFIDDLQYLSLLSPRLMGETAWACDDYQEASNHLKLIFPEGEIDFIVAPQITGIVADRKVIDLGEVTSGLAHSVDVEHPVEIAIKKLRYRGGLLKVRDIFDIAAVDAAFSDLLRDNLHHVTPLKPAIAKSLSGIEDDFCRRELNELPIADEWRRLIPICLTRVKAIAENIPGAL